jgi:hypothetical protein
MAVFVALLWLAAPAGVRSADGVHDGKWKVDTTTANHGIYANYSGSTQKVLFTVCTTAGGSVDVIFNTAAVASMPVGNCTSRTESFAQTNSVTVHLTSGTSVNGTYSVSVLQ